MKKRKKPIFLIATFVLLFAVVAAMNSNLLTMPKTAEDIQKAMEEEQMRNNPPAQKPQQAAPTRKQADQGPLVAPIAEDDEDMSKMVNVKPRNAIGEDDPLITAPTERKNKLKAPDRASVAVQSGWYMNESGANGKTNSKK